MVNFLFNKENLSDIYPTVIKTSLLSILKYIPRKRRKKREYIFEIKINDIVCRIHSIKIETCNFLKLYILKIFESNEEFPIIDEALIGLIINAVCGIFKNDKIKNFYNDYYSKTLPIDHVKPNKKGLSKFLEYTKDQILININTNISEHYLEHLDKLLFELFKKFQMKKGKRDEVKSYNNGINRDILKIKECLLDLNNIKNFKDTCTIDMFNNKYCYIWLKLDHYKFAPSLINYKPKKYQVPYNIATETGAIPYLSCMLHINRMFEFMNDPSLLEQFNPQLDRNALEGEHNNLLENLDSFKKVNYFLKNY